MKTFAQSPKATSNAEAVHQSHLTGNGAHRGRSTGNSPSTTVVRTPMPQDFSTVPANASRRSRPTDSASSIHSSDASGQSNRLPAILQTQMERLSGVDMSSVTVHRNSSRPQHVNAHAFTKGSEIFVAPGQERHLRHEAWHVAQQAQGRVRPNRTAHGTAINDDSALEHEADVMAARSHQTVATDRTHSLVNLGPAADGGVVQRTIGDGHDLSAPWVAGDAVLEAVYDDERSLQSGNSGTAVRIVQQLLFYLGFDLPAHGADGLFGAETESAVRDFQGRNFDEAGAALVVDGIIGPLTMGALNTAANRTGTNIGDLIRTAPIANLPAPVGGTPPPMSVDRIDIVNSAAGANGGFPAIVGGADLNVPGPFEDPATGETRNTHQILFHLDNGNSAGLTPRRELQRTAVVGGVTNNNPTDAPLPPGVAGPPVPGGFTGILVGPDGPPPHEILRPNANTIVIADSPGLLGATAADFPISYMSHFFLTVENAAGAPIARILYDVRIRRTNLANVPAVENTIVSVEKKDFVRGKSL